MPFILQIKNLKIISINNVVYKFNGKIAIIINLERVKFYLKSFPGQNKTVYELLVWNKTLRHCRKIYAKKKSSTVSLLCVNESDIQELSDHMLLLTRNSIFFNENSERNTGDFRSDTVNYRVR